jgi:hypothetical protein
MKYLYPYECEKLQLSSPGELQAAIGNIEYKFLDKIIIYFVF